MGIDRAILAKSHENKPQNRVEARYEEEAASDAFIFLTSTSSEKSARLVRLGIDRQETDLL